MPNKTILLLGALDTKGQEYAYVQDRIMRHGYETVIVNTGVIGEPQGIEPDIGADIVASKAGESIDSLRSRADRGYAMTVMGQGAALLVRELYETGRFHGVLGLGGTGGTSVVSTAMKALPFGVPKVLVSTVASGDTREIVGIRDITLIPSVVDVAGVNRISKIVYQEAVGAICGMVDAITMPQAQVQTKTENDKPIIAISMFGNTTPCVDRCRENLTNRGFEVLVFHCTGVGGETMESLVQDGLITAVLDITTTEWADELCGGIFSAGPYRLDTPGEKGIPHVIVPGCIDMVNFGPKSTVPKQYRERKLYVWNPQVTLMRTTIEENEQLGRIFAEKANRATGPVAFLIPNKGFSILDSEGHEFWLPEANAAFKSSLESDARAGLRIEEMDVNINHPSFADRVVDMILEMI